MFGSGMPGALRKPEPIETDATWPLVISLISAQVPGAAEEAKGHLEEEGERRGSPRGLAAARRRRGRRRAGEAAGAARGARTRRGGDGAGAAGRARAAGGRGEGPERGARGVRFISAEARPARRERLVLRRRRGRAAGALRVHENAGVVRGRPPLA